MIDDDAKFLGFFIIYCLKLMCYYVLPRFIFAVNMFLFNLIKGFFIMCKFAHVKKFKVVTLTWNLCFLY